MIALMKWAWRHRVCLLPLSGLLIAKFYLKVFDYYRQWEVGSTPHKSTDVKFIFDKLTALRVNLGDNGMLDAITIKNIMTWKYWTALALISVMLEILFLGYVIWRAPRNTTLKERWLLAAGMLTTAMVVCPLLFFDKAAITIPEHFWVGISSHFKPQSGLLSLITVETFIAAMGMGVVAALLFASSMTLLPIGELEKPVTALDKERVERAARHVALQMKHLRFILYIGAILLAIFMFRHRATLNWMLEYLKPVPELEKYPGYKNANVLYGHLEGLVANLVLTTSVLNTLLLAALYIPSALVLHHRALKLSLLSAKFEPRRAVTAIDAAKARYQAKREEAEDKDAAIDDDLEYVTPKQEEWLKNRGLTNPLKGQLPKVAAILSPLLAGPIGELLKHIG